MSLGAGSIPEELFGVCYRADCLVVKALRKRAMRDVMRSNIYATHYELLRAVDIALNGIGYITRDIRGDVVEEYARVLKLDIPPREDVFKLLGGRPGWTFEDLLYRTSGLADALHEALMALYMGYVEGGDVDRLGVADFAAYAAVELFAQGRLTEGRAKELLSRIADLVLET